MADTFLDSYYEKSFKKQTRRKPGSALYNYDLAKYKKVPENKLLAIADAEEERNLIKEHEATTFTNEKNALDIHYKSIEDTRRKKIDEYLKTRLGSYWYNQHINDPNSRYYQMGIEGLEEGYAQVRAETAEQSRNAGYIPGLTEIGQHVLMPLAQGIAQVTRPLTSAMGSIAVGASQIVPHAGEGYTQPSVVDPIVSDQPPAQEVESVVVPSEARNQGRTIASIDSETSNFNQSIENFRQRHNLPSEQTRFRDELNENLYRPGARDIDRLQNPHYNRLENQGITPIDPLREGVLQLHPLGEAYSAAESLLS